MPQRVFHETFGQTPLIVEPELALAGSQAQEERKDLEEKVEARFLLFLLQPPQQQPKLDLVSIAVAEEIVAAGFAVLDAVLAGDVGVVLP